MGLSWRATIALIALCAAWDAAPAAAATTSFCVSCVDPDSNYVCHVETAGTSPGIGALQFYCIVQTAKQEGHASCAVSRQAVSTCAGIEKTYTYQGPALPPNAQPQSGIATAPTEPAAPPETGSGPPETVAEAVRNSGRAVKKVAQGTGEAARNAGSRVGNAARSVGSAARTAFGCVWSLFRDCGSGGR